MNTWLNDFKTVESINKEIKKYEQRVMKAKTLKTRTNNGNILATLHMRKSQLMGFDKYEGILL